MELSGEATIPGCSVESINGLGFFDNKTRTLNENQELISVSVDCIFHITDGASVSVFFIIFTKYRDSILLFNWFPFFSRTSGINRSAHGIS